MPKIIVITGSPGTGKEKLAKRLAKKLGFMRLDLHEHYKKISIKYDQMKKCYDLDLKKLEKLVKEKAKENNLIIDSHIAHLLPKKLIDLCIVLTCSNLKRLEKKLKKRKYSKQKIRENLDAEIFQICLMEAKEKKHKIIAFDIAKIISERKMVKKIISHLR